MLLSAFASNAWRQMHILHDTSSCPDEFKSAALAIGNFDGVHLGHQAVIAAARDMAGAAGVPAGAMTFEPHPRSFFQPDTPMFRLTPGPLKVKLFAALGLDMAVVMDFAAALAAKPAARFVRDHLYQGLQVSHVITGSDFRFGKGRDGNPDVLKALGKELGFEVTVVEPRGEGGDVYSSTAIRERLRGGDPRGAARMLGYWWRVGGEVTGGDRRGHGLGYPTANIAVAEGFGLKHGIYAVRVHTGEGRYGGAAYLGTRPSFDDGAPALETFLFDYSGDLYGSYIELEVIEFLRGDEAFATADDLIAQISRDCEAARAVLTTLEQDDPFRAGPLGA